MAGEAELLLALSPLLPPLRFVSRAGLARLGSLKELEPLVERAVAAARPFAAAEKLDRLAASARGFDSASEAQRRDAIAALVRELRGLVAVPEEIAALAQAPARPMSDPPGRMFSEGGGMQKSLFGEVEPQRAQRAVAVESRMGARAGAAAKAPEPARPVDPLATPVLQLRGVGPAFAEKLAAKGLATTGDLLLNLPRRYEDRRTPRSVAEAPVGERSLIAGTIVKSGEARGRRRRFEAILRDDAGDHLVLLWFHFRGSLVSRLASGARVLVSGEVRPGYRGGGKTMTHPDVELGNEGLPAALKGGAGFAGDGPEPKAEGFNDSFGRIVPVYTEIEGVPARSYRRLVRRAVDEYLRFVPDSLPLAIQQRRKLLSLQEALREAHFPDRFAEDAARGRPAGEPRRRLAFEELFLVQLGLAMRRRGVKVEPGIAFRATPQMVEGAMKSLPWPLTGAQVRAVRAIADDMRRPEPMNRLLQGDVGSGKTAVALCAALVAVEDGYQTALMAPTEILAEQHARSLRALLRGSTVHVELVTGGLGSRERNHAARLLRSGTAQIIVGTHALAEEATAFHKLGLVVIDEQHRFGVMTRARLMSKGQRPDVLVMTATPIPRTLALTLYGDLDSSVLDELPPGRTPIATKVYKDAARGKAYEVIRKELAQGRQAYVVLPLVEESEKLVDLRAATVERDRLAVEEFPGVPIGLVHGRQSAAERQEAMERFRRGEDRILVATTVIEVGVDVPNATVMLIEHAERFGLSQLHQLRGRVGRGAAKSFCLLLTGTSGAEYGAIARERLKVMEATTDGFRIAEADLELRGPGEFLGTRQSGLPDFAVAELARDQDILAEAREEAFALVSADPELKQPANADVREQLLHRWSGRLSLARVG
jgi:ATP-dependent DNA helicase RecG